MDSTGAPVSTAVELATLIMSALRYFSGAFRCGFVSMRGLSSISTRHSLNYMQLYTLNRSRAITK